MKKIFLIISFIVISLSVFSQTSSCIYGDCETGYGKYVWTNGDYYVGDWINGKQDGQGTFQFASKSKYTGQFKDGVRSGIGTYEWNTGQKYSGQWQNDLRHGEGTYYESDGTVKIGVWKAGVYSGKAGEVSGCIYGDCAGGYGTYLWASGEKYEGNWMSNMRNGQGTNYFIDGEKYTGEWKSDRRYGYGTNYYVDGTTKAGLWENDKYTGTGSNSYGCISGDCDNGYGIYTWDTGERYEGYWKNLKRNGEGSNYFSNGAMYKGNWVDDQKNGIGYYEYHPTSEYKNYKGDYVNGKMTGSGIFIYKNGQKYVGDFYENYFHGQGTMYYADGKIESGKWDYDKFVGSNENQKGCISGNCSNGYGTYITSTGGKYVGEFKNDNYEGKGTFTFSSGESYTGEFKAGTYSGNGTYTFTNGDKFVGQFLNGTYDGIGTIFYANGTTKSGIWKEGVFIGSQENQTPPVISWLSPQAYSSETQDKAAMVKFCIKSKSELENVQIYVNNELKVNYATRGYTVVDAGCDFTIEREVPLVDGENKIYVKVKNSGGETTSDFRIIKKSVATANIDQKRTALVIGNATYTSSPLRNSANDAKAMANTLRGMNFEVMEFENMTKKDMELKIREFGAKLKATNGIGLFYYAGHGLQLKNQNYLIPIDANIQKEQDVEFEAVDLQRLLGEMDYAANDLNIVILDACRNNPFASSMRSGGGNGLAQTDAPKGTFIAYATAPGQVASDGTGANGLYTQELIKSMKKPGLKIEEVFKDVRNNVYKLSGNQQVPWDHNSIFGDFYFVK